MSAPLQPSSCCSTTEVINVPGTQGATGAAGTNGTDGVSSFSILVTPSFDVPAVTVNTASLAFADTTWMVVGQNVFLEGAGTFSVVSKADGTHAVLKYLNYSSNTHAGDTISAGAQISSGGFEPTLSTPWSVANGGTGSATVQNAITALGLKKSPLTVYAAGTAYSLTATPTALNFGTTSPALTIDAAGTYLLMAKVRVDYNAATFAAVRTGTLKFRRTNNTAADLTNGSNGFKTDIITTLTYTLAEITLAPIIYVTTATNDALTIFGDISVIPTAGSLDCVEACIVAVRLFDQTL